MVGLGKRGTLEKAAFTTVVVPCRVESPKVLGARVVNAVFGIPGALTSPIWLKADCVMGSRSSQTTKGHRWLEPPS